MYCCWVCGYALCTHRKKKSRVTLYVFVQAKEYVLRLTTCHSAVLYCMYGYILVCTYLKFSYCHNHELFFFFFCYFAGNSHR